MKRALLPCCLITCATHAQIGVDRPVVLTATDPAERTVQGSAPALEADGLITLDGARSGRYHWGQASGMGMAIQLALTPPAEAYVNGMELRFVPTAPGMGPVSVNVDGLGARRIYRSDGLPVSAGLLVPGTVATLVYADTAFFTVARAPATCPDGFMPVNGQYCIQRNDTVNVSFFTATRWCNDRGARLCSYGEYIHACTVHQAELEGLFNDWEWIDDTSDHTHMADIAGRWVCHSISNLAMIESNNNYARVRCCLTLK